MLRDLNNFIVPFVGGKWYNLGVQLLDPKSEATLRYWKTELHKGADELCTDMFSHWLTTNKKASWNDVISALKAPSINLLNLADDVEKKLIPKVSGKNIGLKNSYYACVLLDDLWLLSVIIFTY